MYNNIYNIQDYINKHINYFTIVGETRRNRKRVFICECVCGNIRYYNPYLIVNGNIKSCGCKKRELALGINNSANPVNESRLYSVYTHMVARCRDKNNKNYGGRGITVCEEWVHNFKNFEKWAYENGYDKDAGRNECTLDRIDVDKGYSPDNCRWVSGKEQQRNKRNNAYVTINGKTKLYCEWIEEGVTNWQIDVARGKKHPRRIKTYLCNGEELTLPQIADKYKIGVNTLAYRIKQGMTASDAVNTPLNTNGRPRKERNDDGIKRYKQQIRSVPVHS